jgi:hypothetical protein
MGCTYSGCMLCCDESCGQSSQEGIRFGCNHNRVNGLRNNVTGVKKSKYFRRDKKGEKVKRIVPAAVQSQYGTVEGERKVGKGHLKGHEVSRFLGVFGGTPEPEWGARSEFAE